jgi:hypothetical protein
MTSLLANCVHCNPRECKQRVACITSAQTRMHFTIRHPGTYPFCLQELSAWTKPVESSLLTSVPPNIIDSRSLHSPRLSLQRLSDPLLQIYLQQAC